MAGRTGAGVGVVITIVMLGVTTFALFVVSIILWGNLQDASRDLTAAEQDLTEYVRSAERDEQEVREIADQARKQNPPQSVVGYLRTSLSEAYNRSIGNPSATPEEFQTLLDGTQGDENTEPRPGVEGAESASLVEVINSLSGERDSLQSQLEDAQAAAAAAQADLAAQIDKFNRFQEDLATRVAQATDRVDEYGLDNDRYREALNAVEQQFAAQRAAERAEARENLDRAEGRVSELEREVLVLSDQLSKLRGENDERFGPLAEEALVDGDIVGTNPEDNEVTLSLGRNDNLVLGMTFAVYSDATQIRPDSSGQYPRGKAAVEVINIDNQTARARILDEAQGNPIVQGDVIANAVYDPDKVYRFLVMGNFRSRVGRGVPNPGGREEIQALIEQWGGEVTSELEGDVDFVIAGTRPVLPPEPGVDAPIAIVSDYSRRARAQERYDRILEVARRTSIPVLNENRLNTLIGRVQSITR